MKSSSWFSLIVRISAKAVKACAFLPGIISLIFPPNFVATASAQSPSSASAIECCGGGAVPDPSLEALARDASMLEKVPRIPIPPGPKEFFRSSDQRVKPHGGRISLQNLDLSRPPTERELIQSGQLGSALSPSRSADVDKIADPKRKKDQETDNRLFGRAMQKWNEHKYDEAVQLFRDHRRTFADSPWAGEAQLHMGCQAQFSGNWEDAKASFEWILRTHEKGSDIWQKAKLRRAVLHFQQAELDEAGATFKEMVASETSWERRTYAQSLFSYINLTKKNLASLQVCGPESLAFVLNGMGKSEEAAQIVQEKAPQSAGFTLGQLANLAIDRNIPIYAISADPRALDKLPTPFIAHYKDRHYVVVKGKDSTGRVLVHDPRLNRVTHLDKEQFAAQWSGKALLFEELPQGINPATAKELSTVIGGCCGLPRYPSDLGSDCVTCNGSGMPGATPYGMPQWTVNPVNMNIVVQDIPIWHKSAVGPDFEVRITYNSQDSLNQLRPFGNKWVSNLSSYAVESPAQGGAGDVLVIMPDGKGITFTPNGSGGYNTPADNFMTLTKTASYSFDLTMDDGTIYRYGPPNAQSTSSLIRAYIDRHNNALTINYDANSLINTVTDPQGKSFAFSYDTNGRVTRVDDPWGRYATFTYNQDGDLVGQRDMGGLVYGYQYDANKNLAAIGKPTGTHLFYVEPAEDNVPNQDDPYPASGASMWSSYRVTVTDPLGLKEEHYYDGLNDRLVGKGWHRNKRQMLSDLSISEAPKTIYDFAIVGGTNPRGAVSKITYEDGTRVMFSGFDSSASVAKQPRTIVDENSQTWGFTYNTKGKTLTQRDPRNNVTTLTYQPNGTDLATITDALSRLVKSVSYFPGTRNVQSVTEHVSATETRITQFTYNAKGQVETVTNARNDVFTLEYYGPLHFVSPSRLKSIRRGTISGASLVTLTYDAKGRVASKTNTDGYTLSYNYDDLDRLTAMIYPDGTSDQTEWGCCVVKSNTDRLGRATTFMHDPLNRLVWQRDPRGSVTQFRYDPDGNMIGLIDGNQNLTRWEYDALNRQTKKIYADNTEHTRQYSGSRLWRTLDARAVEFTYTYDQSSNLTSHYTSAVPAGVTNLSTSFTYDAMNRPATMTDAIGVTTWTRNRLGEVTGLTTVASGSAWTDTFAYGYDPLGRPNNRVVNGNTVSQTFDDLGRLAGTTNSLGAFTYGYAGTISKLLTSVTVPNGPTIAYDYYGTTGDLRLKEIWNKTSGGVLHSKFNYTYDAAGQMQTWRREGLGGTDPTEYVFSHDPAGQLLSAVLKDTATQTVGKSYAHGYDAAGNRNFRVVDTTLTKDTHNSLNQITGQSGGNSVPVRGTINEPVAGVTVNGNAAKIEGGTKFEGTANISAGNNTVTVVATDYGQPPNVTAKQYQVTVTAGGSATLTYDANGNLMSDGVRTFEWDAMSRLIAVVNGARRMEFIYDGFSRQSKCVEKESGAVISTKRWVWSALAITEERDVVANQLNKRYLDTGLQVLVGANVGNYFYTKDHLGSIRELVDSTGAVRARYEYSPFGERVKIAGDVESDLGFTGHYTNGGGGLLFAPYRAFDPQLGRWLSRDPIAERGGPHLYAYVRNQPLRWRDPRGLQEEDLWGPSPPPGGFPKDYDGTVPYKTDVEQRLDAEYEGGLEACKIGGIALGSPLAAPVLAEVGLSAAAAAYAFAQRNPAGVAAATQFLSGACPSAPGPRWETFGSVAKSAYDYVYEKIFGERPPW